MPNFSFNGYWRDFEFSGDYADAVFGRTLMKMPAPAGWPNGEYKNTNDPENDYNVNNYGYRGPDFAEDLDFLMAGCSFTYGIGVPEKGTWPHLMSQKLGSSYANLSMPGASIEWVVNSIYRYIETFGPPKKAIVILFPDLFRYDSAFNGSELSTEVSPLDFIPIYRSEDQKSGVVTQQSVHEEKPKYLKKPYLLEHVVILEEALLRSVNRIRDLERYCSAANIKLLWGTWADPTAALAAELPEEYSFKNYVNLERALTMWKSHIVPLDTANYIDHKLEHGPLSLEKYGCTDEMFNARKCLCWSECHFGLESEFPESFHIGSDVKMHPNNAHYGVHRYIHIADTFIESLGE